MNCNDAHLAIGAEPEATSPALEGHLRVCASCASYRREMRELEPNIHRAQLVGGGTHARRRPFMRASPQRLCARGAFRVLC